MRTQRKQVREGLADAFAGLRIHQAVGRLAECGKFVQSVDEIGVAPELEELRGENRGGLQALVIRSGDALACKERRSQGVQNIGVRIRGSGLLSQVGRARTAGRAGLSARAMEL